MYENRWHNKQSGIVFASGNLLVWYLGFSPGVMLCEVLLQFWSILIVTGFALFPTRAESMEGGHTVTLSLYFLLACWVLGGVCNPRVVLLLLWFANKRFLALGADSWPSSHKVCCLFFFFFFFSKDLNGKDGWNYTASKQSGVSSPDQRKR